MAKLRVEFEAGWSPQKMKQAAKMIRREISFIGGAKNISGIISEGAEPEPKKPPLKLRCTRNPFGHGVCNTEWEADVFTPCPKCKQRKWVTKIVEAA